VTGAERVQRLTRRRPGPLGTALLIPTWVVLGLLAMLYVVVVTVLAFAAVVVHTARLLVMPITALLGRLTRPSAAT
jgi:hypothetical protein